ncbi:hypothetical protein HPG69_009720 [Diceros bicornis minor]|uniref:Uncharacterized protein n=1 Tax=Diceros bicornis minor TaxID=77932 RepID=A0A7J7EYD9_DICBM|nr:hypothetical protein HPG69_009720 [Diceros bicornis minor]
MAARNEVLALQAEAAQRAEDPKERLNSLSRSWRRLFWQSQSQNIRFRCCSCREGLRIQTALGQQLVLPSPGACADVCGHPGERLVLVVGYSGLSCLLAQYLATAGVGRFGLADYLLIAMSKLACQGPQ